MSRHLLVTTTTRTRSLAVSHRRTLLAALALALGVTACGTPEVVLQAEPATVEDVPEVEDVPDDETPEPVVLEVRRPPAPAPTPTPTPRAAEPAPAPQQAPAPAPAPSPSPSPSPPPSEPVLVVGEDGCVTDVELGIVITCHDPAAGPD